MPDNWLKTWEEPEEQPVEWLFFSATTQEMCRCRARTQEEALRIALEKGIEPGKTDHIRPRFGRSDDVLMSNREFFRLLESLR